VSSVVKNFLGLFMTSWRQLLISIAIVLAGFALAVRRGEAHKPVTSPYTYNEDVFPIVRDRCGRCHQAGGVAPMSLLTYKDAVPWGESIRTELIAGHMPPWSVEDARGRFKNPQTLTARELNVLLTWVSGGNPVGDADHLPPPITSQPGWRLGTPDLVLPLPSEFTLAADTSEQTHEFTLATGTKEARWVRAIDLLPGTAAVVRSATIVVGSDRAQDSSREGTAPERVLAMWVPGDEPVPLDAGGAFRLPAGAELAVRVHYKKTWEYERVAMTDRSKVGVYYADRPAAELRALPLAPDHPSAGAAPGTPAAGVAENPSRQLSFSRVVEEDLQALALYPDSHLANVGLRVEAVRPDGSRVELIRFRPQPDWARRYWFAQPIALPRGTRLEAVATFDPELLPPGAAPAKPIDGSTLRLTLDVVR
jgi:hypothetical protein